MTRKTQSLVQIHISNLRQLNDSDVWGLALWSLIISLSLLLTQELHNQENSKWGKTYQKLACLNRAVHTSKMITHKFADTTLCSSQIQDEHFYFMKVIICTSKLLYGSCQFPSIAYSSHWKSSKLSEVWSDIFIHNPNKSLTMTGS